MKLPSGLPSPWKTKTVEWMNYLPLKERKEAMVRAGYNTFLLESDEVFIDLLTDSGTSAMSDYQWAGEMYGDEAYAGSRNFRNMAAAMAEVYGFPYLVPTHQGRGAEHIASMIYIKDLKRGPYVLSNMYFTTSRVHAELQGGTWIDVIVPEAHDPESRGPFKGNIDTEKLAKTIEELTSVEIGFVRIEANCNMAGGQPFSMKNLKEVRAITKKYGIPLLMDATRALENAYFIKMRENGYGDRTVRDILKEMMSYVDTIIVSSKKDNLVNIGGFLATRDSDVLERGRVFVVVYEGLHTYGGLAGRDMEAIARGMEEMVRSDLHIESRVLQVERFGGLLRDAGVPIVEPIGGHAVYLDAKRFLPHIPQEQYTAQALSCAIYKASGVRSMERGIVSAGRDPKTKKEHKPALELVRLTVPRRVYSDEHLAYAAKHIIELYHNRESIRGLRMVYEPEKLRFFQARFEPII